MGMDLVELAVQVRLVDVAEGDDLGILVGEERVEDLHAAVAHADAAEAHPVVGPDHPARAVAAGRLRRRPPPARAALVKSRRFTRLDMLEAPRSGLNRSSTVKPYRRPWWPSGQVYRKPDLCPICRRTLCLIRQEAGAVCPHDPSRPIPSNCVRSRRAVQHRLGRSGRHRSAVAVPVSGLEPSNQPAVFACLAMVVGLYGILYLEVARVPEHGWLIAAVGLAGKILGPSGLIVLIVRGIWPISTIVLCLTNDLIWWLPFGLYLFDSWPSFKKGLVEVTSKSEQQKEGSQR